MSKRIGRSAWIASAVLAVALLGAAEPNLLLTVSSFEVGFGVLS